MRVLRGSTLAAPPLLRADDVSAVGSSFVGMRLVVVSRQKLTYHTLRGIYCTLSKRLSPHLLRSGGFQKDVEKVRQPLL